MNSRALKRCLLAALLAFPIASRAAYPLPIPTRPDRFPLMPPQELGTVVGFGANTAGQINIPSDLGKCLAISAGYNFSVALKSDLTVAAWGRNDEGQCAVPSGLDNVVAISAGGLFAVALRADGTVVQWGAPSAGPPPGWLHDAVAVSAGSSHVLAVRANGFVVAWGNNYYRQTEVPSEAMDSVSVSAGDSMSIAVGRDGRAVQWGDYYIRPPRFSDLGSVYVQSAGGSFLLRSNGSVYAMSGNARNIGDTRFIASGGTQIAAIYGDQRFVWYEDPGRYAGPIPGSENTAMVACGQTHMLRLVSSGPSRRAQATPQLVNGFLVGLDLTDSGNNYIEPPVVKISGGGGTGATAIAEISQGIVTNIRVTNAGRGYTTPPTVQIATPWFEPTATVTSIQTGYQVAADVIPSQQYILGLSSDLETWTSTPFTATEATFTLPLTLTAPRQFIRLVPAQ